MVTFHLWRVARTGPALGRVATDRLRLRRCPGLAFARILGAASGFTPRDADLRRWAILATWKDESSATRFEQGGLVGRWDAAATERWSARLNPCSSRGRWSRREPFGRPEREVGTGPVAALTRARLHPLRARRFRRAVDPVADQLSGRDGLVFGLGVGEWPVGLQGTFSVWSGTEALRGFAYGAGAHAEVVRRTPAEGWYSEELFARFSVVRCSGQVEGIEVRR
ncbi:MAG TPA: monooxygenase [Mycobacteriales bacterium]|nr:monooxygenase [Mycobacteriales bacterium]